MIVFMLLSIACGAFLHGMRFRVYSIATLITIVIFAAITFAYVPQLAANQPTPWLGAVERVNIYAWMLCGRRGDVPLARYGPHQPGALASAIGCSAHACDGRTPHDPLQVGINVQYATRARRKSTIGTSAVSLARPQPASGGDRDDVAPGPELGDAL